MAELIPDWADPNHCVSLLNTGEWLDPGTWTNWQPEGTLVLKVVASSLIAGCFQQALPSAALRSCLSSQNSPRSPRHHTKRRVLFVGDSSVRLLYYATVRLVDGDRNQVPPGWETSGAKHSDRSVSLTDKDTHVDIDFWWYVLRYLVDVFTHI